MKAILKIATLVIVISFLAACAKPTAAPARQAPVATEAPVVAATDAPLSVQMNNGQKITVLAYTSLPPTTGQPLKQLQK